MREVSGQTQSTDSGVSSTVAAEEAPFIRATAKRTTLSSAKDQLARVFGRASPAPSTSTQPFPTSSSPTPPPRPPPQPQPPTPPPSPIPSQPEEQPRSKSPRLEPPTPPPQPPTPSMSRKEHPDIFSHRPPAVLPKPKRPASPNSSRPLSPSQPQSSTPGLIDVGLVGEERYDKESKAFRYVTASALQNHFKEPKKKTRLLQQYESDGVWSECEGDREPSEPPPPVPPSPTPRVRVATPVMQEVTHAQELKEESPPLATSTPIKPPEERSRPPPPTTPNMTPRSRHRKYTSYKTLDDYESDMDDLCDPEFYMSYASKNPAAPPPAVPAAPPPASKGKRDEGVRREKAPAVPPPPIPPPPSTYNSAHPFAYTSEEPPSPPPEPDRQRAPAVPQRAPLPPTSPHFPHERTSLHTSVRDLEVLEDIYQSNSANDMPRSAYLPHATGVGSPRVSDKRRRHPPLDPYRPDTVSTWDGGVLGLSGYRAPFLGDALPYQPPPPASLSYQPSRTPSRSLASTPSLFRDTHPDSISIASDFDPDNWLEAQLEKLRSKKEYSDPTIKRRKAQEKVLLEELKNIHVDRQDERGRKEEAYSVEGFGSRDLIPQASEPPRRHHSFLSSQSMPTSPAVPHRELERAPEPRLSSDLSLERSGRAASVVKGKPPTPPPRERSHTPPSSPRRVSPMPSTLPSYEATRRPYHNAHSRTPSNTSNFDHLEALLWDSDSPLSPRHQYQGFFQSPKSILKKPRSESKSVNGPVTSSPHRPGGEQLAQYRSEDRYAVPQRSRPLHQAEQSPVGDASRAETPAFPVNGGGSETPLPYHPLLYDGARGPEYLPGYGHRPSTAPLHHPRSPSPGSLYYAQSRRGSYSSLAEPMEVIHHHPVFVKDTSKYWYKPTISREEAIRILKDKPAGTFIVRDSNSFPGAFGLALKVDKPPPGVKGDGTELVRHFLIEPSTKGVKLKGCNNEPVFGTLSALVYQHSITPLALPTKLLLPDLDPASSTDRVDSAAGLLTQGAACNLTYINSVDTETLTGPEAVRRAVAQAFVLATHRALTPVSVHFKVSALGITVTDNTRRLFFRRHYPTPAVTFCGLDPEDRSGEEELVGGARIFGFVARKVASRTENACHIFAELEPNQPANAIVNFVTKVMMGPLQRN